MQQKPLVAWFSMAQNSVYNMMDPWTPYPQISIIYQGFQYLQSVIQLFK